MTGTRVAVVAFDRIRPFHLSVPCAVFGETAGEAPLFDVRVCAAEPGELRAHAGFGIAARYGLRTLAWADIVVVPSWRDPHETPPAPLLAALRRAHARGALVEVYFWLEDRIAAAVDAGIPRERIIVDPGIGFGKTVAHNLELMNGLAALHGLGCPLLVGASRKRTIGALHNEAPAERRLGGSLALALKAAEQGAHLVRVHDVYETVQALRVWRGMRDQALTPRV